MGILISGLAPSSVIFIIGRAITGLGFSGISQADHEVSSIIAMSRPLRQRPTYIGLISASDFFATAVAPLLGGAFTSSLSWRWCFYINIPIAAAPTAVLLFFLKLPTQVATRHMSQRSREKLCELDSLEFTFFAPAVLFLLLAVLLMLGQEKAMLPPYIIMKGTIAVASIYSLSLSASRAIAEYYVSENDFSCQLRTNSLASFQYGSRPVRGASPLQSGVNTLPLVISVLIFAVLSGLITSYTGSYKLIMVPPSLCVLTGVALMTNLTITSPSRLWIPSLVLLEIGTVSGISAPFIAAQTILDPSDMSIGMAIMTFSQDIGEALFISIAQAILLNRLVNNLNETVLLLNPSDIVQLGATNIYGAIPSQDLKDVKIAYNQAVKSAMYVSVSLVACMILVDMCDNIIKLHVEHPKAVARNPLLKFVTLRILSQIAPPYLLTTNPINT
ncbi:uncharacterized protein EAF02_004793 [Botrytis sinoallii]|uniref:uncharacterized protein n=1 Tax=Botrytis sinoallii TaxID=1463999 RepID=UPI001901F511|nr:uncharacterized protein EAF02_004793 [Botrytis sinoallii]KAF7884457.1 hypothetical protein EAF02_004793 [Botrytis sinoallii]